MDLVISHDLRKDGITVIGFWERASTRVKMGGISPAILMKMEREKCIPLAFGQE